jgi:biopolymer transport protein ExbD
MRQRRSIPAKVFSSIETSLLILFLLLFVIVLADSTARPLHGEWVYVNLPQSLHAVSMRGANREDALMVVVSQDGKIFFVADQVRAEALPSMILDRLRDRSVERKVYLSVDKRAKYGIVEKVLDGIRSAGVERVGFLAYQKQLSLSPLR